MKNILLTIAFAILILFTGCVTKSDIKTIQDQVDKVTIAEKCHGNQLDYMFLLREANKAYDEKDQAKLYTLQFTLTELKNRIEKYCGLYNKIPSSEY